MTAQDTPQSPSPRTTRARRWARGLVALPVLAGAVALLGAATGPAPAPGEVQVQNSSAYDICSFKVDRGANQLRHGKVFKNGRTMSLDASSFRSIEVTFCGGTSCVYKLDDNSAYFSSSSSNQLILDIARLAEDPTHGALRVNNRYTNDARITKVVTKGLDGQTVGTETHNLSGNSRFHDINVPWFYRTPRGEKERQRYSVTVIWSNGMRSAPETLTIQGGKLTEISPAGIFETP